MRRAPDDWRDVATLIDNNFRNMRKRDVESKGRKAADEESVLFLGTAFLDGNFDAVFGCVHRQCLGINKPRSSHAGVRVTRGLLHPNIDQRRHVI